MSAHKRDLYSIIITNSQSVAKYTAQMHDLKAGAFLFCYNFLLEQHYN